MDPQKLRKLVRRWAIPVALITLGGGLVGYAVTSRITPVYRAQATVRVVAPPFYPFGRSGVVLLDDDQATLLPAATVMTEPWILQRVIDELRLNTTTDQLSRRVTAIPITNTQLVNVTVRDPDAALATRIANTLTSDLVNLVTQQNDQRIKTAGAAALEAQITSLTNTVNNEVDQLAKAPRTRDTTGLSADITVNSAELATLKAQYSYLQVAEAGSLETVSIAAPAQQPAKIPSPSLALNLALGLLAGLLVALGIAALAEYVDRRLHSGGVGFRHDRLW
jgi:capsular polysaccharide biosynthesis protein